MAAPVAVWAACTPVPTYLAVDTDVSAALRHIARGLDSSIQLGRQKFRTIAIRGPSPFSYSFVAKILSHVSVPECLTDFNGPRAANYSRG